jgi:hypothetical protein
VKVVFSVRSCRFVSRRCSTVVVSHHSHPCPHRVEKRLLSLLPLLNASLEDSNRGVSKGRLEGHLNRRSCVPTGSGRLTTRQQDADAGGDGLQTGSSGMRGERVAATALIRPSSRIVTPRTWIVLHAANRAVVLWIQTKVEATSCPLHLVRAEPTTL